MIDMQVKEPLREIELKSSIKSIKVISDDISKKVKDQYEVFSFYKSSNF